MAASILQTCFNGAATLQLRKPGSRRSRSCARRCFNGAATLQLRKQVLRGRWWFLVAMLQWGRNFAVAETMKALKSSQLTKASFNGAATLQLRKLFSAEFKHLNHAQLQWGRNFAVAETRSKSMLLSLATRRASMGPQLCSCGNPEFIANPYIQTWSFNGAATLQLRKHVSGQ